MKQYHLYTASSLVEMLSTGDESAFSEIYRRFWKKIYVIAFNRLQEAGLAEDTVHDVFASLWANREKASIESLEHYLAAAAKYIVLDKIKKRERERLSLTTSHLLHADSASLEVSLHYKRILELLHEEVEKLPEKCRLIFKYSRHEGMPVRQIAEKLDISPKTVENQLGKALKHLRLVTSSLLHMYGVLVSCCEFLIK